MRTWPVSSLALILCWALAFDHAAAQSANGSLAVHGYLTQGYGFTSRDTVMRLTPEGTSDYRRAAVVARYGVTPKDYFVVQLAHRRLATSCCTPIRTRDSRPHERSPPASARSTRRYGRGGHHSWNTSSWTSSTLSDPLPT
jgi:hypothetical protein